METVLPIIVTNDIPKNSNINREVWGGEDLNNLRLDLYMKKKRKFVKRNFANTPKKK